MNLSLKIQLQQAKAKAVSGYSQEMLTACQQIIETHSKDIEAYLDVGVLFLNFGYLTRAKECFEHVCELAPNDQRALTNLANLARDAGDHAETLRLFQP